MFGIQITSDVLENIALQLALADDVSHKPNQPPRELSDLAVIQYALHSPAFS